MGALSARRQLVGLVIALIALPTLTVTLSSVRSDVSLASDVLAYQLLVVVVALIGGFWPAIAAALAAGTLLDYYFVVPLYTAAIDEPLHVMALVVFVIIAFLVSVVVDQAERRSQAARRSMKESETLAELSGSVLRGDDGIPAMAQKLREVFDLASVSVERGHIVLHRSSRPVEPDQNSEVTGTPPRGRTVIPLGDDGRLVLTGGPLRPADERVIRAFAAQIETGLAHRDLTAEVERARPLEAADKMRTALLAAVGHDLRTPLAAATAAVSSLASTDVQFSAGDRAELVNTAQVSLDRLGRLVSDLLDASRLQAGVLAVYLESVAIDELIPLALDDINASHHSVEVDLPDDLPEILADPVLVQRIVANLTANALRFSPAGVRPRIGATVAEHPHNVVRLRIVDAGPGVPPERRDAIFAPFQREGDEDATSGVGLGLALSRGFAEAMGGTLDPEETPGGGLTMIVTLPIAPPSATLPLSPGEAP